jgi:hypothetical protein
VSAPTFSAERAELLDDLRRQLDALTNPRGIERTRRAIRRLEVELAGGRGRALEAATK